MSPYLKTILRDTGLFLHVPGLMAIPSIGIAIGFAEYYAIVPFIVTAVVSLSLGQLLFRYFYKAEQARTPDAMITAALSWGIIALLGAIPFLMIAFQVDTLPETSVTLLNFQDPWNAIFESFSGFTSTGLSMALHPSELPRSLQWWRSFIEWIGGVGVIVLVLSVLQPSTEPYQLYSAEGRNQHIALTVQKTVRNIWWIYGLYTIASIMLLRIVGMPWWDAINHGLTGIATGGFSIRDGSIGAYPPQIQIAVIVIMIAGAISFPMHYILLTKRHLSSLWEDDQHRAFCIFLMIGFVLLALINYLQEGSFFWLDSMFQWASALGTCGFNTVNIYYWSYSAKLLLSIAMVIGGTAGSTVGGLKMNRFVALFKAILWRFQRISLQPHQILRYELDGRVLKETEANRRIESAAVLAVLWISLLLVGVIILMELVLPIYSLSDVIFEVASALGSVGLSTGITHPDLFWAGKLILIIFMWMGRLEIIPVIFLFVKLLRR